MKLELIRSRIDDIDSAIAELLSERLGLSSEISAIKTKMKMPIEDSSREKTVLDRIASFARDDDQADAMRQIYTEVMLASKRLQQKSDGESERESQPACQFRQVGFVGLGLIGAALCRQVRRSLPDLRVAGFDNQAVLARADEHGLLDDRAVDLQGLVSRSDLIILCASPDENVRLLSEIATFLTKAKVVLDVSSTKSQIVKKADSLDLRGADFIGGHPLFGSEKKGLEAGLQLDITGRVFCLSPAGKSSTAAVEQARGFLSALQLKVEMIEAGEHDRILARTSHMVQILSVLLGAQLASEREQSELVSLTRLSGPSLKQLSRLMKSPAAMWSEIIFQNETEIEAALDDFEVQLKRLRGALQEKNALHLEELFDEAARVPLAIENGT